MGKKNRRSPKSARRPLCSDDEDPVVQQGKTSSSPAECSAPTVGGPNVIPLPLGSSGQALLMKDAYPSLKSTPDATPGSIDARPAKIISPRFQLGTPAKVVDPERKRAAIAASWNLGASSKQVVSPMLLKPGNRVGEARSCTIYDAIPSSQVLIAPAASDTASTAGSLDTNLVSVPAAVPTVRDLVTPVLESIAPQLELKPDVAIPVTQVLDSPVAPVVGIGLADDIVKGCDVVLKGNGIASDIEASNVVVVPDAAMNDIAVANKVVSWVELLKKNRLCSTEVVKLWEENSSSLPSVDLRDTTVEDDDIEKLSLIGTFSSRFPGKYALRKMVNSWSRKCRFHFHASGWIIFTFENVSNLESVLLGGAYFAFGKSLLLKKMPEFFNFNRDGLSVVNVWIQLPNLPISLWTGEALSKICSFVGKPLYSDLFTVTKQRLSFARCLLDIDVANTLPSLIPIMLPDGSELQQPIFYEDLEGISVPDPIGLARIRIDSDLWSI